MRKAGIVGFALLLALPHACFFISKELTQRCRGARIGYKVSGKIPVAGEGGWDYLVVDSDARRLYVSPLHACGGLRRDSHAVVGDILIHREYMGLRWRPIWGGALSAMAAAIR